MTRKLRLKPGRDKTVRRGHPWIFSGALEDGLSGLEPGELVDVLDSEGKFLGRGYANPRCTIAVRLLSRRDEPVDGVFLERRLEEALALRRELLPPRTTAFRLVHGEGDGLPGVVADLYGDYLVLQILTAGAEKLRPLLVPALERIVRPRGIFERSTGSVRREEGLAQRAGRVAGENPPELVAVEENGHSFLVDVREGQKTGFYLDQRPNRELVFRLARGRRVLNAFSYTGSFAVYAGRGGAARVVSVDTSERALALARRHWEENGLPPELGEFVREDAQAYLRRREELFDLLVLDPPALVQHRIDLPRGSRAYRELNRAAFERCAPGAFVLTFTCSPHVKPDLFRKLVATAAADAGKDVQVLAALGPGIDHPSHLGHPEGDYLHGLLLRIRGSTSKSHIGAGHPCAGGIAHAGESG